jgi:LysR family transcriptional activator of dmlA
MSVMSKPEVRELGVFCAVARRGSFVGAANELGTSPAHVSKRIALLEQSLGVTLFHRTTRRVTISAEGELVYRWARRVLDDLDELTQAVARVKQSPSGTLRISTSLRLGRHHVSHVLSSLRRRHPTLDIWLELVDRRVDVIAEGFDIDIRVGEVSEPHLIAHRIAASARILCAAPSYLGRRGAPKSLGELSQHDCLLFRERNETFGTWRMAGPTGSESVKVTGPVGSNHSDIVRNWALDGHGIILLSIWDVAADVKAGKLVRLLPAWRQPADVWAVTASRSEASPKVKVCVDYLKRYLARGPHALVTSID